MAAPILICNALQVKMNWESDHARGFNADKHPCSNSTKQGAKTLRCGHNRIYQVQFNRSAAPRTRARLVWPALNVRFFQAVCCCFQLRVRAEAGPHVQGELQPVRQEDARQRGSQGHHPHREFLKSIPVDTGSPQHDSSSVTLHVPRQRNFLLTESFLG